MMISEQEPIGKFGKFQGYWTLQFDQYKNVFYLRIYILIHHFRVAHTLAVKRNESIRNVLESGLKGVPEFQQSCHNLETERTRCESLLGEEFQKENNRASTIHRSPSPVGTEGVPASQIHALYKLVDEYPIHKLVLAFKEEVLTDAYTANGEAVWLNISYYLVCNPPITLLRCCHRHNGTCI